MAALNFIPKTYFIIGFTNVYYTLWRCTQSITWSVCEGESYPSIKETLQYIQNLGIDESSAVKKAAELKPDFEIVEDYSVRGESWFERKLSPKHLPSDVFTFGKLYCQSIKTCTDVWQLERAWKSEATEERKEFAKNRLIELGELVEFEGQDILKSEMEKIINRRKIQEKECDHYFVDGEKVTLKVKLIFSTSFDTQYGRTYIDKMEDESGNIVVYKGSTPPNIMMGEVASIKGSIKHSEYNGKKQTLIQRIKVLNSIDL